MKAGGIIGVILVLLAVVIVFLVIGFSGNQEDLNRGIIVVEPGELSETGNGGNGETVVDASGSSEETETGSGVFEIEITSSGFFQKTLEINAGDTVTWTNKDSGSHWPASAVHPTHTVYPESGGCIGSKFDACGALGTGESYSFTFNEVGTWGYHDHLSPSLTGKIVVN